MRAANMPRLFQRGLRTDDALRTRDPGHGKAVLGLSSDIRMLCKVCHRTDQVSERLPCGELLKSGHRGRQSVRWLTEGLIHRSPAIANALADGKQE
jgi:hypothetical protein